MYLIQLCAVTNAQNLDVAFLYDVRRIVHPSECCPDCELQYILVDVVAIAHRATVADPVNAFLCCDALSAADGSYMSTQNGDTRNHHSYRMAQENGSS